LNRVNLKGKRFGRLIALEPTNNRKSNCVVWKCLCECGNFHFISTKALRKGTKSCGCLQREVSRLKLLESNFKHGECGTRLYTIWRSMKYRCSNPNNKSFKYYGARSIKVCKEWKDDFIQFRDWALSHGYQDDLTLDRADADEDYSPKNCSWITKSENSKRIKIAAYEKGFEEGYRKGLKDGQIYCV